MSPATHCAAAAVLRHTALAAALALTALATHAGQTCDATPQSVAEVQRGLALAQATAQALESSGAQVVLLARAGQDLSRWQLAWSHVGWAYRDTSATPARWRVLHKLNQCGSTQGQLFRQGLGDFFLDRPYRWQAAFAVPTAQVQQRLLPLLQDNARAAQWHSAPYSMLAYPWSTRYQQSNQWALETLAGALEPAAVDRGRAQAWLRLKGWTPGVLRIDAMTRLGARATRANIAFDDHPTGERFADRIATATADSVLDWLATSGLAGRATLVDLPPQPF